MTSLDPAQNVANLLYVGHNCNTASALHITKRRSVHKKKKQTEINVFQCYVFGPNKAGKSALLMSMLRRPFFENYTPTADGQYAVNVINQSAGNKKTLILREIPEDGTKKLLSNKESLAACDVAVFVYDRIALGISRQGEETGFSMPCLHIAAKNDLDSNAKVNIDSAKICLNMGIDAPIPVSVKDRDLNDVFSRIVNPAECPHLSIPETDVGRSQRRCRQLVTQPSHVSQLGLLLLSLAWQHTVSMLQKRTTPVRSVKKEQLSCSLA